MTAARLKHALFGTLRRQLVVGMVLLQAVMMSLFVWNHTIQQQSALLAQQSEHAVALSRSVATSAAVWVASRDYSGLQEIVNGLKRYPDFQHAIVLDTRGQVLAHTDASRKGFYLSDLPQRPALELLGHDPALVDVAHPILLAGRHVGWVRVGLGQDSVAEQMAHITQDAVVYVLAGLVLAAMLATWVARRLTRRLDAIRSVADAVQRGQSDLRADDTGDDEAAGLARRFNGMLDALSSREGEAIASRDALAKSESRLKQVMSVTGEGIWDWDLSMDLVRHNRSWCTILGLGSDHMEHPVGAFSLLLHADDRDTVMGRIQACLAGTEKYESEHRMYRADGAVIWVQDRGDVVERAPDGMAQRMLGSMIDITERKQAETVLRIKDAAIDTSTNAIAMSGPDGVLSYVNHAFVDLWRLPGAWAAVGRSLLEFWESPDEMVTVLDALTRNGRWQGELSARRYDGSLADVQLSGHMVLDAQGHPICMMGSFVDVSARKLAERELQRERDFATRLIETAPVIILLLDGAGRIQHVNPYFEQVTGFRLRDIQGKDWFSTLVPASDRDQTRAAFHRATHGSPTRGEVIRIVASDGSEREIEWNDQPLQDAQGNLASLLAVGVDVTQKRRLEEALRQAYGQNLAVTEAIHDSLYMLDEAGRLVWWNQRLEAVSGVPRERLKGTLGTDFFVEDDRAIVAEALGKAHGEGYAEIVARKNTIAGPVWYHYNAVRVHDAQGEVIGIAGVGRDISERLEALEALQRSERDLKALNESLETRVLERTAEVRQQNRINETILSASFDGFFAVDLEGRIRDANAQFCDMLGYTDEELRKLSVSDFEAIERPADVAARMSKILRQGQDRFDTRHRRKDGSEVEMEVSVSLVEVRGEKLFYAFTRNITARKLAEAELVRAREEAERANAAKSEFLSRMSHELRTPLNAILGFGQLLKTDSDPPLRETQLDNVGEILQAGSHLLDLVNEVLDLSRIESGRLEISLEAVPAATVIDACLAQIRPLADARQISVTMRCETAHPVLADPMRLKEVLLNLLSNAVKYNRAGGSIHLHCAEIGDARLRMAVRDTGHGIASNALPRLFKPFERLESAYEGIPGTGIGLALSKKLVEAMGGEIGVETVPDAGCTFWLSLPLAPAGVASVEAPRASSAARSTLDAPRSGAPRQPILCIEDNAANLRLVHKLLAARRNVELLEAATAEAGLDIALRQAPALILLDINLPGMNGFEALRHLRENAATRHIPVIAMTANAMTRDKERGLAAGFDAYLTKPIDVAPFLETIDHFLSGRTETAA